MLVKEVMTRDVRTCRETDTANDAARIMWEIDCGSVPVMNTSNFVIGMVTDRDLCMAAYTKGKPLVSFAVSEVMAPEMYCCTCEDTVEQAEGIMRRRQVRRLPVFDMAANLVGILAMSDLARAARKAGGLEDSVTSQSVEDTLAGICASRRSHPPVA